METPSFNIPVHNFQIPFNANHLKFGSEIDKHRFKKLGVDNRFLKTIKEHLSEHIDSNVLFYLKAIGIDDNMVSFEPNKIRFYKNKQVFNAAIPEFEYPVDANTTALWHLNETTGTTSKDETGTYTLSDGGAPTRGVEGKVLSPAISFDGTDDWLQHATLFDTFPPTGTFEFWWSPNINYPIDGYPYLAAKQQSGASSLYFGQILSTAEGITGGKIHFLFYIANVSHSAYTTTNSWTAGTWYHIAMSWGALGMKIYVNGIIEGTNPNTTVPANGTQSDFIIGAHPTGGYINMKADEIRLSSIQRTTFGGVAPSTIF